MIRILCVIGLVLMSGTVFAQDDAQQEMEQPAQALQQVPPQQAQPMKPAPAPQQLPADVEPADAPASDEADSSAEEAPADIEPIADETWGGLQKAWARTSEFREASKKSSDDEMEKKKEQLRNNRGVMQVYGAGTPMTDEKLDYLGDMRDAFKGAGVLGEDPDNPELKFLKDLTMKRMESAAGLGGNSNMLQARIVVGGAGGNNQQFAPQIPGMFTLEPFLEQDLADPDVRRKIEEELVKMGHLKRNAPTWKKHRYVQLIVNLATGEGFPEMVQKTEELEVEIQELIGKLGSDDYDTREEATRRLMEIGPPCFDAVKKLVTSEDAEVSARARMILGD
jgi:hypothetical protein